MNARNLIRTVLGFTIVLSVTVLLVGYVEQTAAGPGDEQVSATDTANVAINESEVAMNELTVVSVPRSATVGAKLMAFGPNGTRRYYNDTLDYYSDVDPSPVGKYTVTYIGAQSFGAGKCDEATPCRRMVIERANLSTGDVTRLYSRIVPTYQSKRYHYSNRWHDVDRINATHFAVADIERDRVFVVNTSSEIITWTWQALANYPVESGGPFPYDFTHVNDVEVLDDGRIMASIGNQDGVVFINRTTGVVTNWTLGGRESRNVLDGQHNPDYIPESRGGPAAVVADSLNDRIVEYQRVNGTWKRMWT